MKTEGLIAGFKKAIWKHKIWVPEGKQKFVDVLVLSDLWKNVNEVIFPALQTIFITLFSKVSSTL